MNSKKMPAWAMALSITLTLTSITTLIIGSIIYEKTFKTRPREIRRRRLHEQRLKMLDEYEHQSFMIESSKNKYNIETLHVKSKLESDQVMIIVHGIRSNYHELLPVAFRYLKDGYNVILYNQRQSGLTGGNTSTFGLYEKFDLEEVVCVARRIYKTGIIGVHGFSMGAATAIMHSELNERHHFVNFYIFDAPYHAMAEAIEFIAKREEEIKVPSRYIRFAGDAFLRLSKRLSYKDIAPIAAIRLSTRPMLLIHGEKDNVTNVNGSRELFGAIHHNQRRLEVFPEEGHCSAHLSLEDEYLKKFIIL